MEPLDGDLVCFQEPNPVGELKLLLVPSILSPPRSIRNRLATGRNTLHTAFQGKKPDSTSKASLPVPPSPPTPTPPPLHSPLSHAPPNSTHSLDSWAEPRSHPSVSRLQCPVPTHRSRDGHTKPGADTHRQASYAHQTTTRHAKGVSSRLCCKLCGRALQPASAPSCFPFQPLTISRSWVRPLGRNHPSNPSSSVVVTSQPPTHGRLIG